MKRSLVLALVSTLTLLLSGGLGTLDVPVAEALPPPSGALGPLPLNHDFSAGASVASAPTNYGFESDLTGWTVDGDPSQVTTPTGGQSGKYVRVNGNANFSPRVVSSEFTIVSTGQTFVFYTNSFGNSGASMELQIATQAGSYNNWTQVWLGGSAVNGWEKRGVELTSYVGQTVKIRYRGYQTFGFDEGAWMIVAPNYTVSNGVVTLESDEGIAPTTGTGLADYTNSETTCYGTSSGRTPNHAKLKHNAAVQTIPFQIPAGGATRLKLRVGAKGIGPAVSASLYLASEGFSVQHVLFNKALSDGDSLFTSCDLATWQGQIVVLKIQGSFPGEIGIAHGGPTGWQQNKHGLFSLDPVSLTSGALTQSHTDVEVPGKGVPLRFTRAYSSIAASEDVGLGWGWTHNYAVKLSIYPTPGSVEVRYADGATAFFANNAGVFTGPPGLNDTMVKNGDNTYTLTKPDATKLNFDTAGKLTSIRDRNNNSTTLAYDGSGYLSTVTDPSGRQLVFTSDGNGRITQIAAPLTRTVTYGYDAKGDLTSVTDMENKATTFAYVNHHMTTVTDSLNKVVTTNIYDSGNRVVEQTDALNNKTCFYYGHGPAYTSAGCPGISPAAQPGQTFVVDARGNKELHQFDTAFRPTGFRDALGNEVTQTYESTGSLCSPSNAGNRCSVTDGLNHTTSFTYDAKGNVLTRTDAENKTWTYTYDAFNDILTETDPLTRVTTFGYNGAGNLTSVTNALNQVTTFVPNADGTLASVTDPLIHTTTFGYNAWGNRNLATDPLSHTWSFTFDAGGRLLTRTDPLSHSETFTYDNMNRQLTATNGLSQSLTLTYDAKGRLKTSTDANNKTTTLGYDDASRLTTVTDPASQVLTYGYDGNGNRTSMTNPRNKTTTYGYDAANRLTSVTDPNNKTTTFGYDAAHRTTSRIDARNLTTTYGYDNVGRITSITYPAGTTNVSATYDALGNMLTMTDASGTRTNVYDNLYRPTSITAGGNTVGYGYDAAGRRTTITYPGALVATYTYDNADRMTSVKDWANKTTSYGYDNANRLTSTNFANGVIETRTYDNADRPKTMLTKKGSTTIVSFTYTLDNVGNRTQVVDTNGTTTLGYDNLYRLNAVTYPNGDTQSYTYDAMGNRLTKVHNGVTTSYTYDNADQMLTAGGVGQAYDNNGNQTGRGADTFTYDAENRVATSNIGGTAGSYTYNGTGLRTARTIGGASRSYTWNLADALPSVLLDSAGNKYLYGRDLVSVTDSGNAKFYYHADGVGSTRAYTQSNGTVKNTYAYDVFGAIRTQTGTNPNEFAFNGELVDSSGLEYLRARYYDRSSGRFLTRDPLPVLHRYPFVLNNPTTYIDPSGLCPDSLSVSGIFGSTWGDLKDCGSRAKESLFKAGNAINQAYNLFNKPCSQTAVNYLTAAGGAAGLRVAWIETGLAVNDAIMLIKDPNRKDGALFGIDIAGGALENLGVMGASTTASLLTAPVSAYDDAEECFSSALKGYWHGLTGIEQPVSAP